MPILLPGEVQGQSVGRGPEREGEEGQVHVRKALGFQTLNPWHRSQQGIECLVFAPHKLHHTHAHALPDTFPLLSLCAMKEIERNHDQLEPCMDIESFLERGGGHLLVAVNHPALVQG